MATQALYRKWRSQTFEDVIGQNHVTETLKKAIALDRVAHAYLFTGPRGTGKTSTARILAKAVNCTGDGEKPCNQCSICTAITEGRLMDLIEIDAASNTSVDDIRDLRDKVGFRPGEAKTKFYIIDEVHMLSKSAFNALLKTLEEPPPHVIFVLATTEPEKIPATIKSRCQRFDFRRIRVEDIVGRLQFIVEQEGLRAETEALTFIARQAGGSMRDAISLLDQLTAYGQNEISLDLVHSVLGTAKNAATVAVVGHLLTGDISGGLAAINDVVSSGVEPRQFTLEMLEYLRGLMLLRYGDSEQFLNLPPEQLQTMKTQAAMVEPARLLRMTQRFNDAIKDFKTGAGNTSLPQLPLELAFVESVTEATGMAAALPVTASAPVKPAASVAPPAKQAPASTPATATPPPVSTTEPVAVGTLTKESLRAQWHRILEEVRRRGGNEQYLKRPMVEDVDIEGYTIVVQFGAAYQMTVKRADKAKEKIIDAFQAVLGSGWVVEFKVLSGAKADNQTAASGDALIDAALSLGGKLKEPE